MTHDEAIRVVRDAARYQRDYGLPGADMREWRPGEFCVWFGSENSRTPEIRTMPALDALCAGIAYLRRFNDDTGRCEELERLAAARALAAADGERRGDDAPL